MASGRRSVVETGQMDRQECTVEELLGPLNEVEQKNAPERLYVPGDVELVFDEPPTFIRWTR